MPARHVPRAIEQTILPRAVRVGLREDANGIWQVLGALDDLAAPAAGIEAGDCLGVLVGAKDEVGITLADGTVVHAWHVIVAEAIHVILAQPVLVETEEVVAGE